MKRNRFWMVSLALVVLLSGCAVVQVPLFTPVQPLREKVLEGEGPSKIVLMEIAGVISEQEKSRKMGFTEEVSLVARVKEELQKAEKDKDVAGILLKIDSPGGTVTASDMIYHELMEFKRKTGKRVEACILGLGASGAYYIASASDHIMAFPTALTGSIGVIAMKIDIHALMDKVGVKNETFKSGENKDLLSPFRPSSPEQVQIMQTIINQLHQRFVDVVVQGRKGVLTREEIAKLADGRIYTAEQALSSKLIDRIGYMDNAVAQIKKDLKLEQARLIAYVRPGSYKGNIYSSYPAGTSWPVSLLNEGGLWPFPEVKFMYLWNPW